VRRKAAVSRLQATAVNPPLINSRLRTRVVIVPIVGEPSEEVNNGVHEKVGYGKPPMVVPIFGERVTIAYHGEVSIFDGNPRLYEKGWRLYLLFLGRPSFFSHAEV